MDQISPANNTNSDSAVVKSDDFLIKKYEAAVKKYIGVVVLTNGCGRQGQYYINDAYKNVEKAYSMLNDQDREVTILPQKYICKDDGLMGFGSAGFSFR